MIPRHHRLAASVMRYHTWPTIHQQDNAAHSFNVLRIYIDLFGSPDPEVTVYIVRHDLSEIGTGDIPFGAKKISPELKSVAKTAETLVNKIINLRIPELRIEYVRRIKICDLLEMVEFSILEQYMGNRLVTVVEREAMSAVKKLVGENELQLIENYIDDFRLKLEEMT